MFNKNAFQIVAIEKDTNVAEIVGTYANYLIAEDTLFRLQEGDKECEYYIEEVTCE